MSKLADAIRRSQRIESVPMGFGAARPAAKPTMLVGLIGRAADLEKATDADFVILDAADKELSPADAEKLSEAVKDAPAGAFTRVKDSAASKDLHARGLDFLAFDADTTPAAALLDEDLGYVLVLKDDAEELFLRSLEPLSLEAIYLPNLETPLTVAGQIELGRVGMLARKPLLCLTAGAASGEDLQCLRAAGVAGIVARSAADVTTLKAAVAALPPRRNRRNEDRPVVSLPRGAAPAEASDDDDDDE